MRALHVYSGNLFGGVETLLLTLARSPSVDGLTHSFALCFEGRLSRELREAGAVVHPLGPVRMRDPLSIRRARRELRRLLAAGACDVVVCHAAWSQALFAPPARSLGVPVVAWLHDAVTGRRWLEFLARRAGADRIVCNSEFTASTVGRMYPGARPDVVHCPVPPPPPLRAGARAALRSELATSEGALVVVQASRLERWKGHELHLATLGRLRERTEWVSWIVGGAQRPHEVRYLDELRRLAARLGIADRVRFVGQRSDVPELLGAADIHFQPNIGPEPFGIAFVEALYAGLPVVTTDLGGAREIVDDTCGIRVPPDEAEAAGALRRLMEDGQLRRSLGAQAPARARALCDPLQQSRRLMESLSLAVGTVPVHA
jgi:glycosyltransferase involved in cell wall biosynthesis